jgi:hypothetical protein
LTLNTQPEQSLVWMDVPLLVEHGILVGIVDCTALHEFGNQSRLSDRRSAGDDDANPAPTDYACVYEQPLRRTPRHHPLDIPAQPPIQFLFHSRSENRQIIAGDQELARLREAWWGEGIHDIHDDRVRRLGWVHELWRERFTQALAEAEASCINKPDFDTIATQDERFGLRVSACSGPQPKVCLPKRERPRDSIEVAAQGHHISSLVQITLFGQLLALPVTLLLFSQSQANLKSTFPNQCGLISIGMKNSWSACKNSDPTASTPNL